jgi:ubiquinone/menaquinone biosynthesis C-methylase UbiE
MKTLIRKHTPKSVWAGLAKTKYWVLDSVDSALGLQKEMVPPRLLRFVGSGDYRAVGDEFLGYFRQLCGLKPDASVLDVGCGIGRMAVPLTEYLSPRGSYEGIDVVPKGIEWCSAHITPKYPNFRFQLADVFSKFYNPTGRFHARDYRFPFTDSSFDFAFLTSVFTHMLPDDVANYLGELSRVLKPGGKCLITWLILNGESEALVERGKSSLNVIHPMGECRVENLEKPEETIAYPEAMVLEFYRDGGFEVEPAIRYGSWCGRATYLSVQDICVAHKAGQLAVSLLQAN